MAKTTANPYDRRDKNQRAREHRDTLISEMPMFAAPPVLNFEDLDALARNVHERGRREAIDEMRPVHAEAERTGRQHAWEEGRAAGHADGERELLALIQGKFEALVTELSADIGPVLADEKAAPEQMRPLLSRTARLLEQLIDSHHNGFREMPF